MAVCSSHTEASAPKPSSPRIVRQSPPRRQLRWWNALGTLLVGALLAGCDSTNSASVTPVPLRSERERAEEIAGELHSAVWNRLALMPAVAHVKFVQQRPITDRVREQELTDDFRSQAQARGIRPEYAERVITAQLEASKLIQSKLYEQWTQSPPSDSDTLRDLTQELRPAIDAATERILTALQLLGGCPTEFQRAMEHAYARRSPLPPQVPEVAWDIAWAPLRETPTDFMPGRAALGRVPSLRSMSPENQPLSPDFAPEEP